MAGGTRFPAADHSICGEGHGSGGFFGGGKTLLQLRGGHELSLADGSSLGVYDESLHALKGNTSLVTLGQLAEIDGGQQLFCGP